MNTIIKRILGGATLLLLLCSFSPSVYAGAWNFSNTCSDQIGHEVETIPPPNLMLMLDRSGSMDWNTQVPVDCHECNWTATVSDPYCTYNGEYCEEDFRPWPLKNRKHWHDLNQNDHNFSCDNCSNVSHCSSRANEFIKGYVKDEHGTWFSDNTYCGTRNISSYYHGNSSSKNGTQSCSTCRTDDQCIIEMNSVLNSQHTHHSNLSASYNMRSCGTQTRKRWDVAVEAINAVTSGLTATNPNQVHFGIGFFPSTEIVVPSGPNTDDEIADALENTGPSGGTPIPEGIRKMMNSDSIKNPPPNGTSAGVLMTDGEPSDYTDSVRAACEHAAIAPLYVIGFGSTTNNRFNDILAVAGGTGSGCNRANLCANPSHYNNTAYDSCDGSYPATNSAQLQVVFSSIADAVSCTFDVDALGDIWKDPAQGCTSDNYDCLKIHLGGSVNESIYHVGSSQGTNGWEFTSSDLSTVRILDMNDGNPDHNYCSMIRNDRIRTPDAPDLTIHRACMCIKSVQADPTCGQSDLEIKLGRPLEACECPVGVWTCQGGGVETCEVNDSCTDGLGNSSELIGIGGSCTVGVGECQRTGAKYCPVQGGAIACSATPGEPEPEVCDGLDNDCGGLADELPGADDSHPGTVEGYGDICHVDYTDNPGSAESAAIANETNRCAIGIRGCFAGSDICNPLTPMPEVCNGLDDDCNGRVDNLNNSWNNPAFSDETLYSLDNEFVGAACYERNTCVCASGTADITDPLYLGDFDDYLEAWYNNSDPTCICGSALSQ